MPKPIISFVRAIDAVNYRVGRFAMYLIYPMAAILLYSTVMRAAFGVPINWVLEMSQFLLAAYYVLGGAWTLQLDSHVRMDLLYARWAPRKRAFADTITSVCLVTYLAVMLWGGISSSQYALEYGQRAATSWRPPMAPIKLIMTFGIFLMLLQTVAFFFRDLARARGLEIE